MYLIIVGAGITGIPLIEIAESNREDVVVIERDGERAEKAAREFDCLVINSDATLEDTLREAGSNRADALITTTDKDTTNIMVCLLGKELDIPKVVSVVRDPNHIKVFKKLDIHTVENPQRLIAENLYRRVKRPSIVDYMKVDEKAEIFEIVVSDNAPIESMTVKEAGERGLLGEDILIVAIERERAAKPIVPSGGTEIRPQDVLTVYSGRGATPEVTDIFGHFEDH